MGTECRFANRDDGVAATYVATNGVVLTIVASSDGRMLTSVIRHHGLAVTQLTTPDNGRGDFPQDPMPFISQGVQHASEALRTIANTPHHMDEASLAHEQLFSAIAKTSEFEQVPQLEHAIKLHEAVYAQARTLAVRSRLPPGTQGVIMIDGGECPDGGSYPGAAGVSLVRTTRASVAGRQALASGTTNTAEPGSSSSPVTSSGCL